MCTFSRNDELNGNRILRSVRKATGMNQISFAQLIGTTRNKYQRIEKELSTPDINIIINFMEIFNLDIREIRDGYVTVPNINYRSPGDNFKLPKSFLKNYTSTMRTLIPIEKAYIEHFGATKLKQFYEHNKVDADYRYILNNPISSELGICLLKEIHSKKKVINVDARSILHGKNFFEYCKSKNRLSLFKKIQSNLKEYSRNYHLDILDNSTINLSLSPTTIHFTPEDRAIILDHGIAFVQDFMKLSDNHTPSHIIEKNNTRVRLAI